MNYFPSPLFFTGFGLAFDVERASTNSGFKPAQFDLGAGKELFGDLRLKGFASAIRSNAIGTLCIVGGNERRYANEAVEIGGHLMPINRAWAIRQMLVHDCGVPQERVQWASSVGNTGGNVAVICEKMGNVDDDRFVIISSHYHLPRAEYDLSAVGRHPNFMPAEAFCLASAGDSNDQDRLKNELVESLGGSALAERMAQEINGLADKLLGKYMPRSDAQILQAPKTQKQKV